MALVALADMSSGLRRQRLVQGAGKGAGWVSVPQFWHLREGRQRTLPVLSDIEAAGVSFPERAANADLACRRHAIRIGLGF